MPPQRLLWRCPRCDAQFLVANSFHSCGRFKLDDLFLRAEPHVRPLFDRLAEMVRQAGDAKLIAQKSRAVFMTRMRFINVQVRRSHLVIGFVMRRRPAHPRFWRVETFSPRSHVAYLRVHSIDELNADVRRWIRAAHQAGRYELERR
ncbi:MAG: DUF5655 domain-containing protein [Vicinamibacterales bacterium]